MVAAAAPARPDDPRGRTGMAAVPRWRGLGQHAVTMGSHGHAPSPDQDMKA